MTKFEINRDISEARCLPAEFYTSEDCFAASKEKIFSKTWQFAGLRENVQNVLPLTLLKGFLDEPLLITNDGELRCVSNVCTHRGNILVPEKCEVKGIRCGYHGRKFDLAGRFVSMPEFEGVKNFPAPADDLPVVPLGDWAGQLFVSLEPEAPFEEFFKPIVTHFSDPGLAKAAFSTVEYEIDAHWAIYCENYLEGFHIPFVHKSLNNELDYDTYKTETTRYSSLQTALRPAGRTAETDQKIFGRQFKDAAAFYYFVFPNLMFNFYPWGLSVNIVEPVSSSHTKVKYLTYVLDQSRVGTGAGGALETVELEDQKVVEAVQRGLRSRLYKPGRYSVKRETGTHHFHRLIAEFMNAGAKE